MIRIVFVALSLASFALVDDVSAGADERTSGSRAARNNVTYHRQRGQSTAADRPRIVVDTSVESAGGSSRQATLPPTNLNELPRAEQASYLRAFEGHWQLADNQWREHDLHRDFRLSVGADGRFDISFSAMRMSNAELWSVCDGQLSNRLPAYEVSISSAGEHCKAAFFLRNGGRTLFAQGTTQHTTFIYRYVIVSPSQLQLRRFLSGAEETTLMYNFAGNESRTTPPSLPLPLSPLEEDGSGNINTLSAEQQRVALQKFANEWRTDERRVPAGKSHAAHTIYVRVHADGSFDYATNDGVTLKNLRLAIYYEGVDDATTTTTSATKNIIDVIFLMHGAHTLTLSGKKLITDYKLDVKVAFDLSLTFEPTTHKLLVTEQYSNKRTSHVYTAKNLQIDTSSRSKSSRGGKSSGTPSPSSGSADWLKKSIISLFSK